MPPRIDLKILGLRLIVGLCALFLLACAVAISLLVVWAARDEWALNSRGREISGVVVDVDWGRRTKEVEVEFTPTGKASAIVSSVHCLLCNPSIGDTLTLEYDPTDPTRVRRAGDHWTIIIMVGVAAFIGRVLWIAVGPPWPQRLRKRPGKSGDPRKRDG